MLSVDECLDTRPNPAPTSAILVDSTRRGKSFPDALSKTVPIWCSVVNRAICLRYDGKQWSEEQLDLYVAASISKSERAQIQDRLQGWAVTLAVRAARGVGCLSICRC